jgi:hypothetical protein
MSGVRVDRPIGGVRADTDGLVDLVVEHPADFSSGVRAFFPPTCPECIASTPDGSKAIQPIPAITPAALDGASIRPTCSTTDPAIRFGVTTTGTTTGGALRILARTGASRSSRSLRCITAPTSGRVTITTTSAAAATGTLGELAWMRPRSATTREDGHAQRLSQRRPVQHPAACSAEKWPGHDPRRSGELVGLAGHQARAERCAGLGRQGQHRRDGGEGFPPATRRDAAHREVAPYGSASTTIVGSGVETPNANDVVVDPGAPRSQQTAISISPDPRHRPAVQSRPGRPR